MLYIWAMALMTAVVVVLLGLAVYFAVRGDEIEVDFRSLPPSIRFKGRRK